MTMQVGPNLFKVIAVARVTNNGNSVTAEDGQRLLESQPLEGIRLAKIGECVAEELWLETAGERRPLEPRGYVHDF